MLFSNLLFKKKTTGESKEEKDLSLTSTSVNMTIKKEKVEIITLPQTEISSCRVKQIEPVKKKIKQNNPGLLQTAGKWFNGLMQAFLQTTTSSFLLPNKKRFQHLNMTLNDE